MATVYLIHNSIPNAFATSRNPENASIAVTTGLLEQLIKEEITGVLANEEKLVNLFATHPLASERMARIRAMH